MPNCVLYFKIPSQHLAWCLTQGGWKKIPTCQPIRSMLTASFSCTRRVPSPGWHQVPLPFPPSRRKPELAPRGEESRDQLSQLQYHSPPGRLGPALSPTGALSASCLESPRLCHRPLELLSLGKSDSEEDLVGVSAGTIPEDSKRCLSVQVQTPSWACKALGDQTDARQQRT